MNSRLRVVSWSVCACLAALAAMALAGGCGEARAEPLDVTYYYLPG